MQSFPELKTERLILRKFRIRDAGAVQKLAGDREVALTALHIPYPFIIGMAEEWITSMGGSFIRGESVHFAVEAKQTAELVGAVGLTISKSDHSAELGYWIGKPFWRQGYGYEAAKAAMEYGFESLLLHRVHANAIKGNEASGKILTRLGMQYEGCLRHHHYHFGKFIDLDLYGILRDEYQLKG